MHWRGCARRGKTHCFTARVVECYLSELARQIKISAGLYDGVCKIIFLHRIVSAARVSKTTADYAHFTCSNVGDLNKFSRVRAFWVWKKFREPQSGWASGQGCL